MKDTSYKVAHRTAKRTFNTHVLSTASVVALLTATFAAPAYAQNAAPSQSAQEDLGEVIVTGSRIVREGYEAPTPLSVVDAAAIQNSSTSNVSDFVNTMPVFSGSQSVNNSQSSASAGSAGVSTLNLRNLGNQRTLVLLDGQRSVGSLLTGAVDVSVVPQQLISRVDVVTGGASAVYGSDAVSGVVNFILDKQFTGVKGEVSGGVTSYGDDKNYRLALTAGVPFAGGRGHMILSGEQVKKEGVLDGPSRDWAFTGVGIVTNPNYTATNGQPHQLYFPSQVGNSNGTPGGIVINGPLKGTAFGQGGVPFQFNYGDVIFDPSMHGGDWQYSDVHERMNSLDPSESRQNVYFRIAYDITDNINLFASLAWGSMRSLDQAFTQFQPGNAAIGANAIKIDNPFIPAAIAARMLALGVTSLNLGSYNYDLPSEFLDNQRMVNRNVVGAEGKFGLFDKEWTWNAYFQNGYSRLSTRVTNDTYRDRFNLALDAVRNTNGQIICRSTLTNPGNGCVPWNEMGEGVNSDAARQYLLGESYLYQHLTQNVWEGTVQGEPISIWAGPVSLSASLAHREEKVRGIADANSLATNWFAGNYKPLVGQYSVTEGALETVVPLAKDETWADNWDMNAAVRFTDYSTSGYVTTWKAGTTYTPVSDIKFRLTRSRDIRAPNLNELFAAGTGSQANLGLDRFTNASPQYRGLAVGNPNLKPEKADTTGVGIVLSPRFLEGFTASVDYWNINLKGAITAVTPQNEVDLCFYNGPTDPNCAFITRAAPTGVAPYTTIGQIIQIQTSSINVAHQNESGIDFEGTYRWNAEDMMSGWAGSFNLHANATLYLRNYINPGVPGGVLTQSVGENRGNGPPDWRVTANLSYTLDPITTSLTARGISSGVYSNTNIVCTSGCPAFTAQHDTINYNRIAGAWFFDAALNYKFGIGEDTAAEAFFNVRNLANKDPAQVAFQSIQYISFTANATLYDTLGRVFRAGLRFKM